MTCSSGLTLSICVRFKNGVSITHGSTLDYGLDEGYETLSDGQLAVVRLLVETNPIQPTMEFKSSG